MSKNLINTSKIELNQTSTTADKKVTATTASQKMLTGPIPYRLTNDYMFRAVLQKNIHALRSLIACLLDLPEEELIDIKILNPIILGDSIDEKTCVLDLRIRLNNNKFLNLEMQISNQGDWPERSLYYLSRTYCNLPRGGSYADILPCIHIGILNFSLFPDTADPYAEYLLSNTKTHQVYSDKFSIRVLDLTQIETGQLQKEKPELYYWAKLFVAKTWEEMQMLSEKSEGIQEAVLTLKELTEDEKIQLQCEAWEMYEHTMASAERFGRIEGKREGKIEGKREGKIEGKREGKIEGKIEGKRETAEKMLRDGMDDEQIQKYTGLSQTDIEEIRHTVE